jgi:hypothetical protein
LVARRLNVVARKKASFSLWWRMMACHLDQFQVVEPVVGRDPLDLSAGRQTRGSSLESAGDFVNDAAAGTLHRHPIAFEANSRRNCCPANRLNIDTSFARLVDQVGWKLD